MAHLPVTYDCLAGCQGFLFEQDPVFTYKSSVFFEDPQTGLGVVTYTERVFRLFAALLLAVYSKYRLWFVPRDVIAFAGELAFAMEVPLGPRANLREVL